MAKFGGKSMKVPENIFGKAGAENYLKVSVDQRRSRKIS